ncbi:GL26680 [Drosophila persimilis]|uniref:GL26680 n=1 Tax=Drosophila persimilis TaxID=7234 RepID=B4GT83_DROPE|nr:GL26680 [Drosophila persimilis]
MKHLSASSNGYDGRHLAKTNSKKEDKPEEKRGSSKDSGDTKRKPKPDVPKVDDKIKDKDPETLYDVKVNLLISDFRKHNGFVWVDRQLRFMVEPKGILIEPQVFRAEEPQRFQQQPQTETFYDAATFPHVRFLRSFNSKKYFNEENRSESPLQSYRDQFPRQKENALKVSKQKEQQIEQQNTDGTPANQWKPETSEEL